MALLWFREHDRTTFESLIGVVLTISTVLDTLLYFRTVRTKFVREGCWLGLTFVAANILLDLPMFLAGLRARWQLFQSKRT